MQYKSKKLSQFSCDFDISILKSESWLFIFIFFWCFLWFDFYLKLILMNQLELKYEIEKINANLKYFDKEEATNEYKLQYLEI